MSTGLTTDQVRQRLSAADLPEVLFLLGFTEQDSRDTLALIRRTRTDEAALTRIADRSGALLHQLGDLLRATSGPVWQRAGRDSDRAGEPETALCTFLATVPEVRAYHRGRGIADAISWRSLSDLGQQVAVHRLTYGEFGLHTHDWVVNAWAGRLYWLGRLQFTIEKRDGGILASAHIPRTGSFAPELVDASLNRAGPFFAEHFPEHRLLGLHCDSWLLDPQLAEVLPEASNIVAFGRRWQLTEEVRTGDADVLFFVFSRRGDQRHTGTSSNAAHGTTRADRTNISGRTTTADSTHDQSGTTEAAGVDLTSLPEDTSLQRAVLAKLRSGGHWHCRVGHLPVPHQLHDGAAPAGAELTFVPGTDPEALVRRFHEVYRVPLPAGAPDVTGPRVPMRMALIAEELAELVGAVYGAAAESVMTEAFTRAVTSDDGSRDVVGTADALGDLVYVLYGMALECGIPLPAVLAEIQNSNLSKLGADGHPILREDGKVLKGPGYHPPDVAAVLRSHGWTG